MSKSDDLGKLREALRDLYEENDSALAEKFNRSLSFQDGQFDRWERAKRLGFGEGASIYNSAMVLGKPVIAPNVWVGPNTVIDASAGEVSIGDWVSVSAGAHIYTHDTVARSLSLGKLPVRQGPVHIGKGCYIGPNSVISAGTYLGDFCVVGANSLVRGRHEANSFVAGLPAKRLGTVVFADDGTPAVEMPDGRRLDITSTRET